jgi:sugar-specific transcriptional regulator TrmB
MEELEIFEELGLTSNESKAYSTLIKHGKLGAGELSRESGVSYSKIYNIIDSLGKKGMIKIIPEKSKKFIPSDPESLIELISQKEEKIKKAKEKITDLKKFYNVSDKNPVIMEIGKSGFYKIIKEIKVPQNYNYTIKYTCEARPEWLRNAKANKKRGVDGKNLVKFNKETEKGVKKWLKVKKEIRQIENEGVAMSITDDEEVMISLIKSNVSLFIRDVPFAKIMKKMFQETYKNAEPII